MKRIQSPIPTFKPNEVYTDLEKRDDTSQLERWVHVLQIFKNGIVNGVNPIAALSQRYRIIKK